MDSLVEMSCLLMLSSHLWLVQSTKELRSLTADVPLLFPVEFLNASPHEIRAAFLRMKAEALGTTSGSSTIGAKPSAPTSSSKGLKPRG